MSITHAGRATEGRREDNDMAADQARTQKASGIGRATANAMAWARLGCRRWRCAGLRERVAVLAGAVSLLAVVVVGGMIGGCLTSRTQADKLPASTPAQTPAPIMRVRIAEDTDRLTVSIAGPWRLLGDWDRELMSSSSPLPETRLRALPVGGWALGQRELASRRLEFCPQQPGTLTVNDKRYDGFLRVLASGQGQLVAINVVAIEDYVAGVVTAEMPAEFGPEALRAQAIIARTYALANRDPNRDWDVSDGQEAQCYSGLKSSDSGGRRAADTTAAMVLMFGPPGQERVFPAFYHSTCGGSTVSVRYVKPKEPEIKPLAGGVRCDWCSASRHRTWQTVIVKKQDFVPKLAARYPAVASLGPPDSVKISPLEVLDTGRLARVQLAGNGRTVQLLADDFRWSVGPSLMRSTLCRLEDRGPTIVLSDGRGWGHGMGLCQYGAGAMSRRNYMAEQILGFYYPGAVIRKAY